MSRAIDKSHACCTARRRREDGASTRVTRIRIPRKVLKGGSYLRAPSYCRRYRPAARFAEISIPAPAMSAFAACGEIRPGDQTGAAIGQVLPLAVGVALSPVPIIAVALMLMSQRARLNGPVFVIGWLIGLAVIGVVVLAVAGPGGASSDGKPATWVSVLKLVLGLLLLLLAVRQWHGRPRPGQEVEAPKWMGSVERFSPGKAVGAGAVLSGANPKNLLLAIGAAAAIAQTGIGSGDQAIAYVVFALIATLGVAAPVVMFLALGDRSQRILAGLRDWMGQHNAVIMAVICLIIGAKLIGDAIGGFSS